MILDFYMIGVQIKILIEKFVKKQIFQESKNDTNLDNKKNNIMYNSNLSSLYHNQHF